MIEFLSQPIVLAVWLAAVAASLVIVVRDLRENNSHLMSLMKAVWVLTVAYSGPLGLTIYWLTGRRAISSDGTARRAFRSVAHCYSGCGMGEIVGVSLAAGLLGLGNWTTAIVTFALAYLFGFALTVGPMVQNGVAFRQAMKDAAIAETPSITVMELVAIGIGLYVAGGAEMGETLFWTSLILSLSCGLLAAWPVNVVLIRKGVKEGMMDPRHTHHGHGAQDA
jgi:hypothetical protein